MNSKDFIDSTRGRFFSIKFVRSTDSKSGKKGELVTRTFRTGVRKGVTGKGMSFDPEAKGLVVLWCKEGYRTIKYDCIKEIKFARRRVVF